MHFCIYPSYNLVSSFPNFYFPISSRERQYHHWKISKKYKTWFEICKDFSNAYYLLENALQYRGRCYISYFSPASQVLTAGMTLITMGDVDNIALARKAF
jgi:hypothetical protein